MERRRQHPTDERWAAVTPARNATASGPPEVRSLVALQRTAGNAAVSTLLAARPTGTTTVQRQATTVAPRGPKIIPGEGTTTELQAERERLIGERAKIFNLNELMPYVVSIERLDLLLKERASSSLPQSTVELLFDGSTLTMTGAADLTWPAVSGRPDKSGGFDYSPERQRIGNVGPIPAGEYWVDPEQLVDLTDRWFYSVRFEDAWGTHRITIHPAGETHTFGRGGFFIHGGTSPGSAGCIDLTGAITSFAKRLGALPLKTQVKLLVRYPAKS
jgi:hypothetical protein